MEVKLNSSIQLNKELIAQQISHQEHLRGVSFRTQNKKYQSIKNQNKLKNIQSPFGDFPKTHLKGAIQTRKTSHGASRKPLYALSYAKSNQSGLSLQGTKLGESPFHWKLFPALSALSLTLPVSLTFSK
jgi:hypothetical protein